MRRGRRARTERLLLRDGAPVARRVRLVLAAAAALAASLAGAGGAARAQPEPPPLPVEEPPDVESAEAIFRRDCAICHGPDGTGTSRGPGIRDAGTAGAHFMLTAGYMPLADPDQPLRRNRPFYTDDEIDALVAYIATFATGPEVPDVSVESSLVPEGGQLFRLHCAACHQFLGTGGVLFGENEAPTLHFATATEVVESLRFGPGDMPAFSEEEITPEEADAIASFVEREIRHPRDEGGVPLGHFGPWSEGFVAWFGGLGSILVAAAWIGRRT